ncbi:hypothetical protein FIM03_02335 [SAR202 cluster bacterium AD-802-L14_MRT_200m]|mgnify:CR=1 FL=1|nr:hypothetical protein [SAR202 cluster bacterium AD-802-L14_MRT_200m]
MEFSRKWWQDMMSFDTLFEPKKQFKFFGPQIYTGVELYRNLQNMYLWHFYIGANDTNLGLRLIDDYATKIGMTTAEVVDNFADFDKRDWITWHADFQTYFESISALNGYVPAEGEIFEYDYVVWTDNDLHRQITYSFLVATVISVCNQSFAKDVIRNCSQHWGMNIHTMEQNIRALRDSLIIFFNQTNPGWENREIPDDLVTVVSQFQA